MPGPVSSTETRACSLLLAEQHRHRPAVGGELDGVGDEVPEDLPQPLRVGVHREPQQRLADQAQGLGLGRGLAFGRRFRHDAAEVHDLLAQGQLLAHQAGDVEQVLDDLLLELHVALDDLQGALALARAQVARAQQPVPAQDRGHGRAQLVGHDGQELVLGPAGGLGLGAGRLLELEQAGALRLGLPPLGDVAREGDAELLALELHVVDGDLHGDDAAVLGAMAGLEMEVALLLELAPLASASSGT